MFKFWRDGWTLSKGVAEIINSSDCFLPERRAEMVQGTLELARNLKLPTSGLPVHQQVMLVAWLAIVGIGPGGASYADNAIRRYAIQHSQLDAVEDVAVSARGTAQSMYGYSNIDMESYKQ